MAKKQSSKKTTKKKTTRKASTRSRKITAPAKVGPSRGLIELISKLVIGEAVPIDQLVGRVELSGFDESEIEAAAAEVKIRILDYATQDRQARLGTILARLDKIYTLATVGADANLSAAISSQVQSAKLLALYPKPGEGELNRAEPSGAKAADELALVEQHLRPLGLAPSGYPISGVARVVAQRLAELEAAARISKA